MNAETTLARSSSASTTPAPRKPNLFTNRAFSLLWLGQTVSTLGTYIFDTTLVVWIAQTLAQGQNWTPLAVSGVFVAAALPPLLIAPLAGVIVDRVSRRGAMLVADGLRALCALIPLSIAVGLRLPFIPDSPLWTLGIVYAAVVALAIGQQFFSPAALALVGDLVGESEQAQAQGMLQGSASLALLVGPAVAPPLLLAFGPQWALIINSASFAVSFVALMVMGPIVQADSTRQERRGLWWELGEGFVYLLRSRVLRTLAIVTALAIFGVGALNAIDVFFTIHNLHTPIAEYGLLNTTLGVGLIVGSIGAGALAKRLGLGRLFAWGTLIAGALVMVYSRLGSFVPALVVLFLIGAPLAAVQVAANPLILRETPKRLIGRVESLMQPVSTAAMLVGAALAGWLDSGPLSSFGARLWGLSFGPVDTIYLAAGALIIFGGLYALVNLRN
jgi:MFS family permease